MAKSHGSGGVEPEMLAACGHGVVFEAGALVFHPENIEIADDVYIGHQAILKGYYRNKLRIGAGTWIGQQVFIHAAGGVEIGRRVGIGPGAKILTSKHQLTGGQKAGDQAIIDLPLTFAPVRLEDGCDIGVGAIVLPGVTVGERAQVGAGAVVTRDVGRGDVVAGIPARSLSRDQ